MQTHKETPPVTIGAGEGAVPGLDADGEDVDPGIMGMPMMKVRRRMSTKVARKSPLMTALLWMIMPHLQCSVEGLRLAFLLALAFALASSVFAQ